MILMKSESSIIKRNILKHRYKISQKKNSADFIFSQYYLFNSSSLNIQNKIFTVSNTHRTVKTFIIYLMSYYRSVHMASDNHAGLSVFIYELSVVSSLIRKRRRKAFCNRCTMSLIAVRWWVSASVIWCLCLCQVRKRKCLWSSCIALQEINGLITGSYWPTSSGYL